jgi:hypothetical protein
MGVFPSRPWLRPCQLPRQYTFCAFLCFSKIADPYPWTRRLKTPIRTLGMAKSSTHHRVAISVSTSDSPVDTMYCPHMPRRATRLDYLLATYRTPEAHDPGWLYSTIHGYGQIAVAPWPDGRQRNQRVHVYVCELVHGPRPEPHLMARHLCTDNRACFWAEHLVWGTGSQNQRDRHADDFYRPLPTRRYSDVSSEDVQRIRILRAGGTSLAALGRAWDISVSDVRFLLHPTPKPPTPDEPRPTDEWTVPPPPEWLRT